MSAVITVLNERNEESIQMTVDPEDKIGEIVHRCKDYWFPGGCDEDHSLKKRGMKLKSDETVISAGIERGDVVKFIKDVRERNSQTKKKNYGPQEMNQEDLVPSAKEWLGQNIGLDPDRLEVIAEDNLEEVTELIFKVNGEEDYLTVMMKNGRVSKYVPKNTADGKG